MLEQNKIESAILFKSNSLQKYKHGLGYIPYPLVADYHHYVMLGSGTQLPPPLISRAWLAATSL